MAKKKTLLGVKNYDGNNALFYTHHTESKKQAKIILEYATKTEHFFAYKAFAQATADAQAH